MLTTAGIVLGVAVLVGMRGANESAMGSFTDTVNKIAGSTQLQVSSGDTGFPEEILERVQAVRGVRVASAVIEAVADTQLPGQGNLLILGVDLTGDQGLRSYDLESGDDLVMDDPLVFLAQPDSLMITRDFARRNHLETNSRVPMATMGGVKQFTVRAIMKTGGMASAFGGNLAIMDVYAAQKIFGRGRRFDRIDLAVKDGFTVPDVQLALQTALGPGFTVEPPADRGTQFESMLSGHRVVVNILSTFALFIGMFIIYNSFAIAVTQRRYEIGVLRALGATRRQISRLFLMESVVEGIVGSAVGVVLGELIAHTLMGTMSGLIELFYGTAQTGHPTLAADPLQVAGALAIGVLTSVIAAWIPAREATRVDPVVALQKGKYQAISEGEQRARGWAGLVLAACAAACLVLGQSRSVAYVGLVLTLVSALLLTPAIALGLTRLLRPALQWLRPVEGALAADSLIQSPRRTSGTVAALMLSITMVVGFGGLAQAAKSGMSGWLESVLKPDLCVATSERITSRQFRFPGTVGEELKKIEGVGTVESSIVVRLMLRDRPIILIALEAAIMHQAGRKILQGDEASAYRAVEAGQGVFAADVLVKLTGLRLGDIVEIPTPSGTLHLPVVAIIEDYSDPKGTLLIDRSVYIKNWKDTSANVFYIYLSPGATAAAVRQRILDRLSGQTRLFVLTNQEVRSFVLKSMDQAFAMFYAQVVIAAFVAILGIVNTLTVSITDRRKELGVLQAVGALRNQIRHTIWMEAVCVALIGLIMGTGLGAIFTNCIRAIFRHDLMGVSLPFAFPTNVVLLVFPVILVSAFLAAIGPAESAVRGSLVEALEYE
jgi:putative ABC transport system permease protein